jgi:hypothetical protein
MVSPRTLPQAGGRVLVRPFVVLAAKCLGPGPLRLQMVKLAHELGGGDNYFDIFYSQRRRQEATPVLEAPAPHTRRRAA